MEARVDFAKVKTFNALSWMFELLFVKAEEFGDIKAEPLGGSEVGGPQLSIKRV